MFKDLTCAALNIFSSSYLFKFSSSLLFVLIKPVTFNGRYKCTPTLSLNSEISVITVKSDRYSLVDSTPQLLLLLLSHHGI